ncbi:ABC transporter substrate-binding protein [Alkaliphilus hydrothermalis]|uniref:ABC-type transport system substrate-binding protein n=1 Tax=Alkaliphilus hydrothermalis TaxID=1482730 RepID=A0ABS2NNW1_9FIRM|nr:ABC transporter substrate-binding protein [Alkaliphilus hydrothermalis]MBM7614621.1 ABC-type transport system substrate-binding protein [Alkaliphilus hydrothermalis]
MKKKMILLLVFTLVASMFLAACAPKEPTSVDQGTPTEEAKPENLRPLVVGSADFNGDFHTGWTNSTYDKNIRQLVWGFGLMTDNPAGEVIDSPLVEEKTVSEDLSTWTFKIKEGVKFHNGEELTVSDIKFTYEFYMDKEALEATGATSNFNEYIDTITIDEAANTITFKLNKVIYTTDSSIFYETWILAEDMITEGATAASQTVQEYVKANISNPIGYGPYVFVEYKESEYVKLKANPDYIGNAPAIKEIIVKHTPSETELDQLLLGEVDMLFALGEAEKIDPVLADDKFASNNYFRHGGGTMVLHTDYEAFQLTEVRQAFAYAFNRPKVIELFLGKYGVASQGPYSKNHWMMYEDNEKDLIGTAAEGKFEKSLTNYDIVDANGKFDEAANIAKAHELLDIAVAKTDGEYANLTGNADSGYMWKGEPLNIKIALTTFWSDTYHLTWNEEYVSKLGFGVTIVGLDWPIMYGHWTGNTTEERQYHAYVGGIGYVIKDNPRANYGVDKIKDWGHPSSNGPRFTGGSTFTAEEWDQLMIDIENTHPITGRDQYRELWREYVKTFNKEVPVIPVYSNQYFDLYTGDLENFSTNALWPWTRAILDANWK